MALNNSGKISLAGSTVGESIAAELGLGATTQISLNDTAVRTLAGVSSGQITIPTNFWGKSNGPTGQQAYTTAGTYTWVAPVGVTSVCVVCVGGGAGGSGNTNGGYAGAGGGLGWKNNIPVVAGNSYTVVVGAGGSGANGVGGNSYFINTSTVAGFGGTKSSPINIGIALGGGYVGDGGGYGGGYGANTTTRGSGGGGAGGYSGNGGNGANQLGSLATAGSGGGGGGGIQSGGAPSTGGGGVGILGEGASGAAGSNTVVPAHPTGYGGSGGADGSGGNGGAYGGGGSGGDAIGTTTGGVGAVRIIWGSGRAFPSTNTGNL